MALTQFGFDSFEEALEFFKLPTYYERANGIFEVKREIIHFTDTFKMVLALKSSGRKTMVLFYASKGRWIYWVPLESDIKSLKEIVAFYETLDKENDKCQKEESDKNELQTS